MNERPFAFAWHPPMRGMYEHDQNTRVSSCKVATYRKCSEDVRLYDPDYANGYFVASSISPFPVAPILVESGHKHGRLRIRSFFQSRLDCINVSPLRADVMILASHATYWRMPHASGGFGRHHDPPTPQVWVRIKRMLSQSSLIE